MSVPQPPSGRPYAVHASAAVIRSLDEFAVEANRRGQGPAYLDALRRLYGRLTEDPRNCGEQRFRLPALGLAVYHAMDPIRYVRYAVDERRRIVYIRDVRLIQDQLPGAGPDRNGHPPVS